MAGITLTRVRRVPIGEIAPVAAGTPVIVLPESGDAAASVAGGFIMTGLLLVVVGLGLKRGRAELTRAKWDADQG